MPEIEMFLDDAKKSIVTGLPAAQPDSLKLQNPFYVAIETEKQGNRKEAERIYLELLNLDFDNPVLCAALGMNYAQAEKNGIAHLLLQKALAGIPNFIEAFGKLGVIIKPEKEGHDMSGFLATKRSELLNAIGTCYKHENHCIEARRYFEEAQAGIPLNPDIQNNLGTLFINEGNPQGAFENLDAAVRIDPNHGQAHWNRALAFLELGDYKQGWQEYDWGIAAKVRVDRNFTTKLMAPLPFWNGEKDAVVAVYGEQGIGDEIMFASMMPELIRDTKQVVFECHRKLHKLFAASFPTLDIYPTREDEMVSWPCKSDTEMRYPFTHKLAIGSLGKFYRNSLEDFPGTPYLTPTPVAELTWNEMLATLPPGPKIGISWIGGHKKTRVEVRSLDLERLLPILQTGAQGGAQFISLQYTPQEDEVKAFEDKHGIKIHQFPESVYSSQYDDTAGLVANLDLVITVCTSVVHLAGSMGVPTWVMTPSRPAWRYRLDLDGMPWYANTILYRQAKGTTDWTPVITEVAIALHELLHPVPYCTKEAS